jgi:hypothetical protein
MSSGNVNPEDFRGIVQSVLGAAPPHFLGPDTSKPNVPGALLRNPAYEPYMEQFRPADMMLHRLLQDYQSQQNADKRAAIQASMASGHFPGWTGTGGGWDNSGTPPNILPPQGGDSGQNG